MTTSFERDSDINHKFARKSTMGNINNRTRNWKSQKKRRASSSRERVDKDKTLRLIERLDSYVDKKIKKDRALDKADKVMFKGERSNGRSYNRWEWNNNSMISRN